MEIKPLSHKAFIEKYCHFLSVRVDWKEYNDIIKVEEGKLDFAEFAHQYGYRPKPGDFERLEDSFLEEAATNALYQMKVNTFPDYFTVWFKGECLKYRDLNALIHEHGLEFEEEYIDMPDRIKNKLLNRHVG